MILNLLILTRLSIIKKLKGSVKKVFLKQQKVKWPKQAINAVKIDAEQETQSSVASTTPYITYLVATRKKTLNRKQFHRPLLNLKDLTFPIEASGVSRKSLLRQYNISKKEIIESDGQIIFGEFAWSKIVKTNYLKWVRKKKSESLIYSTIHINASHTISSGKKGEPKEYYTLECLLYILKNVGINHAVYISRD
jgi:hypothetical protein